MVRALYGPPKALATGSTENNELRFKVKIQALRETRRADKSQGVGDREEGAVVRP